MSCTCLKAMSFLYDRKALSSFFRFIPGLPVAASRTVGGQAVMEGVMMRNRDSVAVAVRKADGEIVVHTQQWFYLTASGLLKKPFIRGFPLLVETLVNGIKALNFSAQVALEEETGEELKPWALACTVAFSFVLALLLFVVAPHLLSVGLQNLGYSGDTHSLSFHVWDGFFKLAVFLLYVAGISLLPDIRRVFQYHGAEHKVIWTYEQGNTLLPENALKQSRLHPRCGTAFLLFVLCLSIVLHAILIPALLLLHSPESVVFRHLLILLVKFALMIPVSALAYELIKYTARHAQTPLCRVLCQPGLFLQRLTTCEPDKDQLEVAIAALQGAIQNK